MKRLFPLLMLSSISAPLSAQPELDLFHLYHNGGFTVEHFNDIFLIAEEGFYACGTSEGRSWLMRLDEEGISEWSLVDEDQLSTYFSVIEADNGDAVVGGFTNARFIAKRYTSEGQLVWRRDYGEGRCKAVIELKNGAFVLAGYLENNRSAMICIEGDGEPIWSGNFGGQDELSSFETLRETEGGIIAAGHIYLNRQPKRGWIVKVNFNGEQLWAQRHLAAEDNSLARTYLSMVSTPGGFYLTGYYAVRVGGEANPRSRIAVTRINDQGQEVLRHIYNYDNIELGGMNKLPDRGLIIFGLISVEGGGFPFAFRVDSNLDVRWQVILQEGMGQPQPQNDRNRLLSAVVDGQNRIIACGGVMNPDQNRGMDGLIVRLEPDIPEPQFIYWSPEDTAFCVLPGDSVDFTVRAHDQGGEEIRYLWTLRADTLEQELGRDTSVTVSFDSLGEFQVQCRVSNDNFSSAIIWRISVTGFYISEYIPESLQITVRRREEVVFNIRTRALGEEPINYNWLLDDEIVGGNAPELSWRFNMVRAEPYQISVFAFQNEAADSVEWQVFVRSAVWAWWPRELSLSLPVDTTLQFGVEPFNPESDSLVYRWELDGDSVDADAEADIEFGELGRHEVTAYVSDGGEADTVRWEVGVLDPAGCPPLIPPAERGGETFEAAERGGERFEALSINPNPFNDEAVITVHLVHSGPLRLSIFNINGQKLIDLMDSVLYPGEHQFLWSAQALPAGVYLVRMETTQKTITKKALLIK